MLGQIEPWDRNLETKESTKAYAAFLDYAAMGPTRSLRDLAERYRERASSGIPAEMPPTRKVNTLFTWSTVHRWQERVHAWDADQALKKITAHNQAIEDMNRRHAAMATALQSKVIAKIQALQNFDLDARTAGLLLDLAAKLERTARGEPEEIIRHEMGGAGYDVRVIQQSLKVNMEDLSDDELRRIAAGEDPLQVLSERSSRGAAEA